MSEPLRDTAEKDAAGPAEVQQPAPSKAAAGCLLVPAGVGGCMIVLAGLGALAWVINKLVGEGTVLAIPGGGTPFSLQQLPGWAWFLACMLALRSMLAGVRKPWLYWLTVLCLAWGVLMTTLPLAFGISLFAHGENPAIALLEWTLCLTSIGVFAWFSFSRRNRRYYHP